jgi:hypothetical protein
MAGNLMIEAKQQQARQPEPETAAMRTWERHWVRGCGGLLALGLGLSILSLFAALVGAGQGSPPMALVLLEWGLGLATAAIALWFVGLGLLMVSKQRSRLAKVSSFSTGQKLPLRRE